MQNHLVIFVKNPVLGTVKTRLAKSIGDESALEVYKDLMLKCQEECLNVNAKRHLFYSKEILKSDFWPNDTFDKKLQVEGNLGDKIEEALQTVFKEKGKVLIIGSDCYDLTASIIEEAFIKLEKSDVVIGPANDGGYYLLGTNEFHYELFKDITWSTETVLKETIDRAKSKGLSVSLLQELIDLDTIEDLEKSGYQYKKIETE